MSDQTSPVSPIVAEAHEHVYSVGMTLRQYYAAKAMQTILLDPLYNSYSQEEVALSAFSIADAMIKFEQEEKE